MITPIYIYRPLLNAGALARYAEAIGLKNVILPVDMHATVAYSNDPVDWNVSTFRRDLTTVVAAGGARQISRFGDSIVLEFQSKELSARWAQFVMAGASWDYPDYRPHVTLAKDETTKIERLIAPSIELRFGPERREALTQSWEAKTKQA